MTAQNTIINIELLDLNEPNKLGEITLWREVIITALEDLSLPLSNKRYRTWQKQAAKWFDKNDEEFLLVCEYANLLPTDVLKLAKKIIS
jgi:hypothetical protein